MALLEQPLRPPLSPGKLEEVARLLRRDHGDVQDKVVEAGRACR
jgi:hypothetical protein